MRRVPTALLALALSSPLLASAAPPHASGAALAWKKLGAGCPPRFAFSAVCDHAGEHVLVYGGETMSDGGFDILSDLWQFTPADERWTELKANPSPGELAYHSATFDEKRGAMWLFGGSSRDLQPRDGLWRFDLAKSTWTQLAPSGERPAARFSAGLFYDAKRDRLVLWSGCKQFFEADNAFPDLWTYDIEKNAWTRCPVPAPARWQSACVLIPERDELFAQGGFDERSVTHADAWTCALETGKWTELGKGYEATDAHQALWDASAGVVLVHGGATPSKDGLSGAASYDFKKKKWTKLAWKGADPGPRAYHAALLVSNSLWVFGGTRNQFNDSLHTNESWSLPLHP